MNEPDPDVESEVPSSTFEKLRNVLRARRQQLRISQRELAQRMFVPQSMISDLETGLVASPKLSTLERWVTALGGEFEIEIFFPEIVVPQEKIHLSNGRSAHATAATPGPGAEEV